ncbi:MAG TPA: LLM class flavin-dependent oxidoreductase [Nitrososphaera sp.]
MFTGRFFLGLGRGESLNEVPTGPIWPSNQGRFERPKEAIKLIKVLWMEDWVTFRGMYYQVKDSNLHTKPLQPIPVFIAGIAPRLQALTTKKQNIGCGLIFHSNSYVAQTKGK